jgi:uncharacterized alkaline shock family protein YloU
MPERRVPGRSAVSRRAISDIVRSAVLGSYGVAGFASRRPIDRLIRWLRIDEPAIGIRYDDGFRVVLHLRIAHGLPVGEVARQVDSAVRYALERALDRQVDELTIHVDGLDEHAGIGPPVVTVVEVQESPPEAAVGASPRDNGRASNRPEPVSVVSNGRNPDERAAAGRKPRTRGGGPP